ncbi:hypothetical protein ALT721_200006 [Alteromonas alvinellae]
MDCVEQKTLTRIDRFFDDDTARIAHHFGVWTRCPFTRFK